MARAAGGGEQERRGAVRWRLSGSGSPPRRFFYRALGGLGSDGRGEDLYISYMKNYTAPQSEGGRAGVKASEADGKNWE